MIWPAMEKLGYYYSIIAAAAAAAMEISGSLSLWWPFMVNPLSSSWPLSPASSLVVLLLLIIPLLLLRLRKRSIYLVDYACFEAPSTLRVPTTLFMEHSTLMGRFSEESLKFQKLILERSGLGEQTAFPPAMWYLPPRPALENARAEAEMSIFPAIEMLFNKCCTWLDPKDVGVLVVNCSLFAPVPSVCSMISHRFKMRSDIKSYQLSGMGCSASVISLSLAQNMLKVHPNSYAIIVSTENITQNWYLGNRRSMAISNCLFRMGTAAILLSNKPSDARRSKYRLKHVVRTITGYDDKSFRSVFQEQDDQLNTGVCLSKDLTKVAGDALRHNITRLAPLVLPWSEQFAYLFSQFLIKMKPSDQKLKPYVPDFNKAFDHFCIHAGGRAIIDELEKALQLRPEHAEPSRMALHRFGNTSSSTIWYELAYLEAKQRIKPGNIIWQIAIGSGFKCNSAVWVALPKFLERVNVSTNPWRECIHNYPVQLPSIQ